MNNRLMYIFTDNETADRRVPIVEGMGFEVAAVRNECDRSEEEQQALEVELEDFRGLWIDVEASQISEKSVRLVHAADKLGIKLLGRQRLESDIPGNVITFIGLPEAGDVA